MSPSILFESSSLHNLFWLVHLYSYVITNSVLFNLFCVIVFMCFYFIRIWFFGFTSSIATMCGITDFLCYYMLKYHEWSWLVVLGFCQSGIFTFVAGVIPCMTVSVFSIYNRCFRKIKYFHLNWVCNKLMINIGLSSA